MRPVHAESHGIYGSHKIAEVLRSGMTWNRLVRNTVAKAMRELGLDSRVSKALRRPRRRPTPSAAGTEHAGPRLHGRAPNRKWVTDITYLPTAEGWVYLAVVIDLFSRKVVGWALATSLATTLVSEALRRAIESRRPTARAPAPLGSGCQYTSDAYQQTLKTLGIDCSMSRTGNCCDNAVVERFFWSLKHEWTNHEIFENLEDARLSVFKYIETFYNPVRLHQTLEYLSPDQYEAEHAPATAA